MQVKAGLQMDDAEMRRSTAAAVAALLAFEGGERATGYDPRQSLEPPPEGAAELGELLQQVLGAATVGMDPQKEGFFAYVHGGGLYSAALADFMASVLDRVTSMAALSPELVRMEQSVLRWMCNVFEQPDDAQAILTSGGSIGHLTAFHVIAHARSVDMKRATFYVSDQSHYSVAKAARVVGFPESAVRVVNVDTSLHIDMDHLASLVRQDRAAGMQPMAVVGNAGTTSTGAIDDLDALAAFALREGLWFHVDAALGGFFQLTERGRERLSGISRADSIVVDPHKSLFLPHGTGGLVVREARLLHDAFVGARNASYLSFDEEDRDAPNFSEYSIELSRDFRGLRVWLPLHLHGVAAFRDTLDERLDFAEHFYGRLLKIPQVDVPWRPELSTVAFRCSPDHFENPERATQQLLDAIHSDPRFALSTTVIDGHLMLRACILTHRARLETVDALVELIEAHLS